MFSQTVEYALRAAVDLASRGGAAVTVAEVAGRTRVPRPYLAKVVQRLARAGIVTSRRGVSGGVALARPADRVTVLEVVNAVEPVGRIDTCPLGVATHGPRLCPLHRRLDDALAAVEAALAATTLADLAGAPSDAGALCDASAAGPSRVPLPVRRP